MFNREQCVKIFIRCFSDQLELMEQHFLVNTRSYDTFKTAIQTFYQVMIEVNKTLDRNGHDKIRIVHISHKTGHC